MIKKTMKNIEFVTPTSIRALLSALAFFILYPSRHSDTVKSRSIRNATKPNGTVDSHIFSHSSAVHEGVEQFCIRNQQKSPDCEGP